MIGLLKLSVEYVILKGMWIETNGKVFKNFGPSGEWSGMVEVAEGRSIWKAWVVQCLKQSPYTFGGLTCRG